MSWETFVQWINTAWDWLNKPLPVVGFSTLVLAFMIFKIVASLKIDKKKYSGLDSKIQDLIAANQQANEELKKYQTLAENESNQKDAHIQFLESQIARLCAAIPNKNVKRIGERKYARKESESKETAVSDSKKE